MCRSTVYGRTSLHIFGVLTASFVLYIGFLTFLSAQLGGVSSHLPSSSSFIPRSSLEKKSLYTLTDMHILHSVHTRADVQRRKYQPIKRKRVWSSLDPTFLSDLEKSRPKQGLLRSGKLNYQCLQKPFSLSRNNLISSPLLPSIPSVPPSPPSTINSASSLKRKTFCEKTQILCGCFSSPPPLPASLSRFLSFCGRWRQRGDPREPGVCARV